MGLFDRFKRVVKSNINDIISKSENPEKVLNQLIVEMNEQLIESKKSVAMAIADEKKLERQYRQHQDEADDWERKAMLAVKAEKDDLAKQALVRKKEADEIVGDYQKQWEAQHESVETLKGSLRQLQNKIEEAQRKKNLLIAQARRAETTKRINSQVSRIGDSSAFEAFDRMQAKVENLQAEADAIGELADMTSNEDSLEQQFKQLESGDASADQMLEDLKKKMGQIEDQSGNE